MREQGGFDIRMVIRADGGPDPRRYNLPTATEIAVLLPGSGYSEAVANRDIVLHAYCGGIQRITETHCAYDSLHYVLLFPQRNAARTLVSLIAEVEAISLHWNSNAIA